MRYTVRDFSPSMVGVWDEQARDMVKNPRSGRRKLFYRRANAQKLAKQLNDEEGKKSEQ